MRTLAPFTPIPKKVVIVETFEEQIAACEKLLVEYEQWLNDGRPVTINNRVYKLDECTLIAGFATSYDRSDPRFWREDFYKTINGKYMRCSFGGEETQYKGSHCYSLHRRGTIEAYINYYDAACQKNQKSL